MPGKRGAPYGNRNRLKHGRYSAQAKVMRAKGRVIDKWCKDAKARAQAILDEAYGGKFDPHLRLAVLLLSGGRDDEQDAQGLGRAGGEGTEEPPAR